MRLILSTAIAALLPLAAAAQTAQVEGTDGTNSVGYLSCAAQEGAPLQECGFELIQKEDGTASLRVMLPGGHQRFLYATNGEITSTDSTGSMSAQRLKKRTVVTITPGESFDIPNSLLDGN